LSYRVNQGEFVLLSKSFKQSIQAVLISSVLFNVVNAEYGLPEFTGLVESNSPAVVNISTTKQTQAQTPHPSMQMPDLPPDSPLNEFFEKFFDEQKKGPEQRNARSLGSGFIISADGYIVTNHHVVKDADEIIVRLSDRRQLDATLIGSDASSDVALLKVEAEGLPVVSIGSSTDLKVGQWVLAIGSPFGFDHSVTAGIVSAKGRSLPNENYVPFIQTDVAINPGNSGGPLFNLDGEVVGINSQIYSRTGGFMGLSFAIPIDVAMEVIEQIKETGSVSRGWLGVYIQEVTRELAESFGMEKPSGALVAKIMPNSPAEKSALQVGDIVIAVNGVEVPSSGALPPIIGRVRAGETVTLKIIRHSQSQTIKVKVGQLPPTDEEGADAKKASEPNLILGAKVLPLTSADKASTALEFGLKVMSISEGALKTAGVKVGDVIQMLNGEKIDTIERLNSQIQDLEKGRFSSLLVQRQQGPQFLALKIPE
jgi:serine protease Do|tara:strand:- start:6108 stop:7553 length:1446 start_codon:yes stop_codon:yes gene_type:complete